MDNDKRIKFLKDLYKIRFFEDATKECYKRGLIVGGLHPCIGQEAVAVGAGWTLEKDDYILSDHRADGHLIVKGADIKYMMAELMGRETGLCKGRGGSLHLIDKSIGFFGPNGVIGGGLTVAVGTAISSVYRKTKQVTACFFGDGGANIGVFHESLNLAGLWKLPVIFICKNNGVAATTQSDENMPIENIGDRASAYGIYGNVIDGNDVENVYQEVQKRVDAARNGEGSSLIECKTYRYGAHCMVLPDTREEISDEGWNKIDPVAKYESKLLTEGVLTEDETVKLKKEALELIEEAVRFAENSKLPDPDTVGNWVYAS